MPSQTINRDKRDTACHAYTVTNPPTGGRGNGEPITTDTRRATQPRPAGVAAGTGDRRNRALPGLPRQAGGDLQQPPHRVAAGAPDRAPRPDPGLPRFADAGLLLRSQLRDGRTYPRGAAEPPVGTTLQCGAPIGLGDCLQFDHVATGRGGWIERRNGSMRGRRVDWRVVAFWLPMQVL